MRKRRQLAAKLYDCIGRAMADFVTRGISAANAQPSRAATDEHASMDGVLRSRALAARGGIRQSRARGSWLHRASGDDALHGETAQYRRASARARRWSLSPSVRPRREEQAPRSGPDLSSPAHRRSAAPLAAAGGDRNQQGCQRRDCLPDAGALRGRRAALPSAARHLADGHQPGVEDRGHRGMSTRSGRASAVSRRQGRTSY